MDRPRFQRRLRLTALIKTDDFEFIGAPDLLNRRKRGRRCS